MLWPACRRGREDSIRSAAAKKGVRKMDVFLRYVLPVIMAGVGLGAGFALRTMLLRFRRAEAEQGAATILAQANREAENIRKEAELKAREDLFKRREEIDRELEAARKELREHERRVQRLEDSIEQKLD